MGHLYHGKFTSQDPTGQPRGVHRHVAANDGSSTSGGCILCFHWVSWDETVTAFNSQRWTYPLCFFELWKHHSKRNNIFQVESCHSMTSFESHLQHGFHLRQEGVMCCIRGPASKASDACTLRTNPIIIYIYNIQKSSQLSTYWTSLNFIIVWLSFDFITSLFVFFGKENIWKNSWPSAPHLGVADLAMAITWDEAWIRGNGSFGFRKHHFFF